VSSFVTLRTTVTNRTAPARQALRDPVRLRRLVTSG
jgi:hypothetical protein